MAGTKNLVEGLPAFVAETILAAGSSVSNSLEGIDARGLTDRALCYVRNPGATFRYFDTSTEAADGSRVVAPIDGDGRWIELSNASLISFPTVRVGTGATAPTIGEVGPTLGYVMAINDVVYCEVPIPTGADRTGDIIVGIGWAPVAAEVAKTVQWQVDAGFESTGHLVNAIDFTVAQEFTVPGTAFEYVRSGLTIPVADWAADPSTDEIHLRITRIAASADPVNDPGLHHIAVIFPMV